MVLLACYYLVIVFCEVFMSINSLAYDKFFHYVDTIIENHKLSHSYIIELSNYDEDLKCVFDFIKMILLDCSYDKMCQSSNKLVHLVDSESYPDLYIIEADGNYIKKNQLLNLQKDFSNKSLLDGKRIYLIKNAEKLNPSSANTILKFLEEPEDNIVAILLTDNRYHILDTILSRCQILSLNKNNLDIVLDDDLVNILRMFTTPRDFFLNYQDITTILVDKNNAIDGFHSLENLFVQYINGLYLNYQKISNDVIPILDKIGIDKILLYLSIIEDELPKLEFNINYKLWLDSLFSRFILGG